VDHLQKLQQQAQQQQQQRPAAAGTAAAASPLPTACLDSQNWSPFPAAAAAEAAQQPPLPALQQHSAAAIANVLAAHRTAHGMGAEPSAAAAGSAAQQPPAQQQAQQQQVQPQSPQLPPPTVPPHAEGQENVFRRFTWQRDAFAYADRCNLAAWGLTEVTSFQGRHGEGRMSGYLQVGKGPLGRFP
jgi:hypothetical protein